MVHFAHGHDSENGHKKQNRSAFSHAPFHFRQPITFADKSVSSFYLISRSSYRVGIERRFSPDHVLPGLSLVVQNPHRVAHIVALQELDCSVPHLS